MKNAFSVTRGEKLAQSLFKERYSLDLEKIPESNLKSADFIIKRVGAQVAIAEVKDLDEVIPTKDNTHGYTQNEFGWWVKSDNSAGKIANKIAKASRQVKSYKLPKLLIIVNHNISLDVLDLKGAIDGFLEYASGIRVSFPYSKFNKKIRAEIIQFDALIWIETNRTKISKFNNLDIFFFPNNDNFIKNLLSQ